ncbi:uncharacterized protein LOC116197491 isoform X1 [Punica granatum]|uniref:Uncharacterized protein LOC116197491 isoform X1 n=1 Tax=Punica granatum TaxID=22663 RepID=A0A6P8CMB9_PUNGR|nr:uncharacterized protein LOC116197491 isoform X1 [Punica granatum]
MFSGCIQKFPWQRQELPLAHYIPSPIPSLPAAKGPPMDSKRSSSPKAKSIDRASGQKDGFLVSCWGRLKLMKLIPWTKRKTSRPARMGATPAIQHRYSVKPATLIPASLDCKSIADSLSVVQPRPLAPGGFKYDALSYSQNFDEGSWQDQDLEAFQRGFSSRYAAPNLVRPPPPLPPPPLRSLIDE